MKKQPELPELVRDMEIVQSLSRLTPPLVEPNITDETDEPPPEVIDAPT